GGGAQADRRQRICRTGGRRRDGRGSDAALGSRAFFGKDEPVAQWSTIRSSTGRSTERRFALRTLAGSAAVPPFQPAMAADSRSVGPPLCHGSPGLEAEASQEAGAVEDEIAQPI